MYHLLPHVCLTVEALAGVVGGAAVAVHEHCNLGGARMAGATQRAVIRICCVEPDAKVEAVVVVGRKLGHVDAIHD